MDLCESAMIRLQAWIVDHHGGEYDVSTPWNIAMVMIALTHEPPVEGEDYEAPIMLGEEEMYSRDSRHNPELEAKEIE